MGEVGLAEGREAETAGALEKRQAQRNRRQSIHGSPVECTVGKGQPGQRARKKRDTWKSAASGKRF